MLKRRVEQFERRLILSALTAADWSQRRAADALGVLPTTLHEKMKRLGIPAHPDPHAAAGADEALSGERVLEEFHWHGRVEGGQALEITGVTGTLRAEIGSVDEVDLLAIKRGAPVDCRNVVVKVSASKRAVVVMAQTLDGGPVGPEVTVDVAVQVPASVRLITHVAAGGLETHGVRGVLELSAREELLGAGSDRTTSAPISRMAPRFNRLVPSKSMTGAGSRIA
jgi:regulatory Fis family protein